MAGKRSLGEQAEALYIHKEYEKNLDLARRNWPKKPSGQLNDDAAEVARYAFVAGVDSNRTEGLLWYARAMTASVLLHKRETAARLLYKSFYEVLAWANSGKAEDAKNGYEHARSILEEMKRLAPEDSGKGEAHLPRQYHERRGISFIYQATRGKEPLPGSAAILSKAEAEYKKALKAATSERSRLKVRGNLALVQYLMLGEEAPKKEARKPMLEETVEIQRAAKEGDFGAVAGWASVNRRVMERGKLSGWVVYDVT